MLVLNLHLVGKKEFQHLINDLWIAGPTKGNEADLASVDRLRGEILVLHSIVLGLSAFSNSNAEYRKTKIGVDGGLVTRSVTFEAVQGLLDDALMSVRSGSGNKKSAQTASEEVLIALIIPTQALSKRGYKFKSELADSLLQLRRLLSENALK